MRDIGARIRRYRLSRYGSPHGVLRHLRWAWPILGLWLAYVTLFSEHGLFRIWRMSRESARVQTELETTRKEITRREAEMKYPRAFRERAEHILRERSGYAGPGDIIYRIRSPGPDSLH